MSIKNLFNGLNNYSSQLDFKAKAIQVDKFTSYDLSSNSLSTNNLYVNNNKLNYQTLDVSLNFNGALAVSVNVKLSKVGNQVSILLPYLNGFADSAPNQILISQTNSIPLSFRTSGKVIWGLMHVLNNNSLTVSQGTFYISTNGELHIYNGFEQFFTPSTLIGFREQSLNYSI